MAAMAPALTDAPAEARHIHFKLAAASSGLSPSSTENNVNSTNILLSSPSAATANGKRRLTQHPDDSCRSCCCNGKSQPQEPISLGKLQPLVTSYLCSDVAPMVKESHKVQGVLKSHGLLNGSLFLGADGGDYLLRKALTAGGQVKGLINGGAVGAGGSAMVPVNGLARKVAVPNTALPEKGCIATVNGDSAKHPASGEALLPLSSKSGDVVPLYSAPRGDGKHQRETTNVFSQTPGEGLEVKSEMDCTPSCGRLQFSKALSEANGNCADPINAPQTSPALCLPSQSPSVNLESVLQERTQQSQRRHVDLSGRLQRLCKRLQVVQAKQVERHVRHQLSGFLEHALTESSAFSHRAEPQADALGHFLKGGSIPSELEKLHLSGSTNLRTTEAQFDSDATESSSGGESDVEEEELARVDIEQRHVKLWRRAEGRFALERASIISRWTWLQAHISDLEYRIRQQADIYRQIRTSKGSVELGGDLATSSLTRTERAERLTSQNAAESLGQFSRCQSVGSVNSLFHSSIADGSDPKSSAPDGSCTAARVRSLISCKRRRLIQPSMVQNLNSKVQRLCCSQTRQCDVNACCVMCGDFLSKADVPYERPLVERAMPCDSSIHATLSLQSDLSLSVHLQRLLKSHWQTRRVEKPKPVKKPSLRHKLSLFSSSSALSKHRFRLSNSHMAAVRLSRHKSRSNKSRRQAAGSVRLPKLDMPTSQTPCRMEHLLDRSLNRKRAREPSLNRTEFPKLLADTGSPSLSQSSVLLSTPGFLSRQLSLPTDGSTPLTTSSLMGLCSMPMRRKRSENSFDINNIVIPMSVAATTRVEKLQYKEIITPSWRQVDMFSRPLAEDDSDEVEDMSDAAFSQLHQKCEEQERSRWRWTALTPASRRGSRSYKSLDGRTTPSLSGTNPSTPQPSSPDNGHFHLLQDYGPILSPMSPPSPDPPSSRDAHTPHPRDAYRLVYSEDTRCSTPDCSYEEKTVQPWEARSFPLSEDPVAEPPSDPNPHPRLPPGHCRTGSESEASSP